MNGVLPVDKPEGPTSHDLVAMARRALGTRRIGHTGTLDPFADGLLLLCIGPATRLAEYLTGLDKTYEAVARLGEATDTLDRTGTVVARSAAWRELDPAAVRGAFEAQRGRRLQAPPAFSAKRLGGRRAYELARAGVAATPEPVEVEIHELEVTGTEGPDVRFRVRCSSGTYVRAVARDAGEALGVGAHLRALRRTRIGWFDVAGALRVDDLADPAVAEGALVPPLEALRHLPQLRLDEDDARRIRHGQRLHVDDAEGAGLVALRHGDALVAVAEAEGGVLRPRKVFP